MQTFICDICGGTLAMDKSGETAVCEFCGLKYPKARLQEKIQEIKGSVKVEGPVEVVGISTRKKLLDNAEMYLNLGQVGRAQATYTEIIEKYPEEPEGWWGLYRLTVAQFKKGEIDFSELMRAEQYASAAKKLKDLEQEYEALWFELHELYEKKDIFDIQAKYVCDKVTKDAIDIITLPPSKNTNKNINKLQEIVTARYVRLFHEGKVSFFRVLSEGRDETEWFWDGKTEWCRSNVNDFSALREMFDEGLNNAKRITPEGSYTFVSRIKRHGVCLCGYGYRRDNSFLGYCIGNNEEYDCSRSWHLDEPVRIVFHLGSTLGIERMDNDGATYPGYHILILDRAYTTEEISLLCDGRWKFSKMGEAYAYFRNLGTEGILAEIASQRARQKKKQSKNWKAEGKCPRCGGEMKKSFLGRKCVDPDCFGRYFGIS